MESAGSYVEVEREIERGRGTGEQVLKKGGGNRDGNCASKCPIPLLELFNY